MTVPFDYTKPFETKDGLACRVLCSDLVGDRPLVVAVKLQDGNEGVFGYQLDGKMRLAGEQQLFNIPEKHPLHDILVAVAKGKKIEFAHPSGIWLEGSIFVSGADNLKWRIAS